MLVSSQYIGMRQMDISLCYVKTSLIKTKVFLQWSVQCIIRPAIFFISHYIGKDPSLILMYMLEFEIAFLTCSEFLSKQLKCSRFFPIFFYFFTFRKCAYFPYFAGHQKRFYPVRLLFVGC